MEHEEAYMMMMDALDGELADDGRQLLEAHLRACPPCDREWQALLAIDSLFRRAPMLAPAAGFTQRTLAQLPSRRFRLWVMGLVYLALLLSGALPMLAGLWVYKELSGVLNEPTFLPTVWQTVTHMAQVAGVILGALLNGLGKFVIQYPAVLGWLLVIAGLVSLWGSVFRHLVLQPVQSPQ